MSQRLPFKLAVVSHAVPPTVVGTALRIHRLFNGIAPDDYTIFTCRDIDDAHPDQELQRLPCEYVRINRGWRQLAPRRGRVGRGVEWCNLLLRFFQRERHLRRLLRSGDFSAVLAFSGDDVDLPAACLAAKRVGLPFLAAIDDDYIHQWPHGFQQRFARWVEPWMIRHTVRVLAISDYCADAYRERYGIDPVVLYNPTARPVPDTDAVARNRENESVHIVYTGSLNHFNIPAFNVLAQACELLNKEYDMHVDVYTPQPHTDCLRRGLSERVDVHAAVGGADARELQRSADILFLPMSLAECDDHIARTSCPFKLTDYLISGRPILAYAPPNAFVTRLLRENDCGLVTDCASAESMAAHIRTLLDPDAGGDALVHAALRVARERFDCRRVEDTFIDVLKDVA